MNHNRNIGLDILRLIATMLVIVCHSGFFSVGISYSFLSYAGILAVEIFFVLSGLLVGKSMILAITDPTPSKALKRFYINRLFRTLPLYYIMLFVTALISKEKIPLSCFVFLQNFNGDDLGFLSVSWSLSVEAWFYFLIPPIFLLLFKFLSRKFAPEKAVFIAIGILCLIPFLLRVLCVFIINPEWDYGIRKQIPLRLDSIMMGVFLAALKFYRKNTYLKLSKNYACFILSLAGIAASYLFYCTYLVQDANFDNSPLSKIFTFTLLPLLCCLLVMYMENSSIIEKLQGTKIANMICDLSTWSYGIYLLQLSVFTIVSKYFVGAGFSTSWLGFLGAVTLTIVLSAAAYWLIEVQSTKLRNKIIGK